MGLKVLMISGKIGSGKDTVEGIMTRLFKEQGFKVISIAFADPLKDAVAYLRNEDKGLYYSRDGKDKDDQQIRRKLLAAVGEGATMVDPNIFSRFAINRLKGEVKSSKNTICIVTDLRKEVEMNDVLNNSDGVVLRLKGSFAPCTIKAIAEAPIECELDYLDRRLDEFEGVSVEGDVIVVKPYDTRDNVELNQFNENKAANISAFKYIAGEVIELLDLNK